MKKINFIIFLLFFSINLFSLDEKSIFENIVLKNNSYLPESFSAIVEGKEITQSLNQIPLKSRKGKVNVEFLFHKKYGERIIVNNVEEIYKDRFAAYLSMYNEFKIFLIKKENYESFIKNYEWKIHKTTNDDLLVKMRKIRNRLEDYFILQIDKKSYLIKSVMRYENNNLIDTFNFKYSKIKDFILLSTFSFNGKINNEKKSITFYLTSFNINRKLTENDFLD